MVRKYSGLQVIVILFFYFAVPVKSSWMAIDIVEFAQRSPLIITGKIVKVDYIESDKMREYDYAYIKIDKVLKNVFKDLPLKYGDTLKVLMSPVRVSGWCTTDIRYKEGRGGLWILKMYNNLEFSICSHPDQLQPRYKQRELWQAGALFVPRVTDENGKQVRRYFTRKEWLFEKWKR